MASTNIRVANAPLEPNKHVVIALANAVYGVGRKTAGDICDACNIKRTMKVSELTEEDAQALNNEVTKYKIEGDLRREIQANIKRLRDIGCYRGKRHRMRLPSRGQRTRTNARTRKGPRKQQQIKK